MVSFVFNTGAKELQDGTINPLSDTLKFMLVNSTYSPNRDDDVVDAGGASDAADAEITATNYTKGWGGAGRKTLGSKTITVDKTNDRVVLDCADPTWTALGGASNDTVVAAIVIKEGGANDTTSRLIAYLDLADTPTNGSDFTLTIASNGIINWTT